MINIVSAFLHSGNSIIKLVRYTNEMQDCVYITFVSHFIQPVFVFMFTMYSFIFVFVILVLFLLEFMHCSFVTTAPIPGE